MYVFLLYSCNLNFKLYTIYAKVSGHESTILALGLEKLYMLSLSLLGVRSVFELSLDFWALVSVTIALVFVSYFGFGKFVVGAHLFICFTIIKK